MKSTKPSILKNIRLMKECIRLRFATYTEYRINFYFDIIMRLLEFALFFIMWQSILGANGNIPGWDIQSLFVLYSFENIFLSLLITFMWSTTGAWKNIHEGRIDKYLCRPTNVWLMVVGERMGMAFGGYFVGFAGLLLSQLFFGINLVQPALIFGVILIVISIFISTLFALMIATLSFWLGKIEFINSIFESLMEFDQFPQTIFPWQIQTILSITIPFLFAHTLPALAILGRISLYEMGGWILIGLGIACINWIGFSILWKKGVKRYEAHGG
ncbi:MAG: ABC-2 family transporter protein [Candidatus Diapherotrites archaeon]